MKKLVFLLVLQLSFLSVYAHNTEKKSNIQYESQNYQPLNIEVFVKSDLKDKYIYQKINGKKIGLIRKIDKKIECQMKNSEMIELGINCLEDHVIEFKKSMTPILAKEIQEGIVQMVSFKSPVKIKDDWWIEIKADKNSFFVKAKKDEFVLFQDVVTTFHSMESICLENDNLCQLVDDQMREEMIKVSSSITCYDIPYLIKEIVYFNQKPFYHVYLDKSTLEMQKVITSLPLHGFVPVYDSQGKQQATFFSRGC